MKEILYRGKVKKHPNMPKANWVFGDHLYLRASDKHYICDGTVWIGTLNPVKYEVDPETVGQYTGLTDKNGTKIFEGDIVRQIAEFTGTEAGDGWETRSYDGYRVRLGLVSILPSKGTVMTRQKILREDHDGETVRENEIYRGCTQVCASRCEVVGNIHDNPELLK